MFVELICRSYFSFLEGTTAPEQLVRTAAQLGMRALALVDRNGLYGATAFYRTCQEFGIRPIIGAQVTLEGHDEIILLCRNLTGYQKLSQLLTAAHRGRAKGDPLVRMHQLAGLGGGDLICLLGGTFGVLPRILASGDLRAAKAHLASYQRYFSNDTLYITLTNHLQEGDQRRCDQLRRLAVDAGLLTVATNHACYANADDGMLYDVLQCIKDRSTLPTSHARRPSNHQRYLKDDTTMRTLFADDIAAVERSGHIADSCELKLDFSQYRFPEFSIPDGAVDVDSYLTTLCQEALPKRYPAASPAVVARVSEELRLIAKLKLSGYFLVVWDIVQYARGRGIPVQGRGSAANSIVAYILGITQVDPIAHDLFLGRFLHEEMRDIPDIDLDFASTRREDRPDREDVIQYIYRRYGEDHVAMVCTYVTFQTRSAIREVGRVLEMPEGILERMAVLSGRGEKGNLFAELEKCEEFTSLLESASWEPFKRMVNAIANLPRHLGIHVGGMVIASCPIAQLVPLEPARMEGRVVCQWDKDMVGDAGLVKVDILGLGMLAVLRDAAEHLGDSGWDQLEELSFDDPAVYATLATADTVGVFQVESRAQMQSLPRTRPTNFSELGIQVALIRPGPLQGNMVSPYIRRKKGEEAVSYIHPSLKSVLQSTLGVILFQEQVLLCAVAVAGFTAAQADALRRAMSRKRSRDAMQKLRSEFLLGAEKNKVSRHQAEQVFDALEGFALYGFCKSHALSFARLTYLSTWLKVYHPAAFLAALLDNQPMGFYPVDTLIADAKRHGVVVHPVCVNSSCYRCTVDTDSQTVQLGFQLVQGINADLAREVEGARDRGGPFQSVRALVQRTQLKPQLIERLIQAGACDNWGLERRELLWQLWLLQRMGLFCDDLFSHQQTLCPPLTPSSEWDKLRGEYQTMHLSVKRHPIALLRGLLDKRGVILSPELETTPDEDPVAVAGMVVCRQRPPTAKGFAFLTLEDEKGLMNIILSPQVYEASRAVFRQSSLIQVHGQLQKREGLINVLAQSLLPILDE